jgi:hypothetical protein
LTWKLEEILIQPQDRATPQAVVYSVISGSQACAHVLCPQPDRAAVELQAPQQQWSQWRGCRREADGLWIHVFAGKETSGLSSAFALEPHPAWRSRTPNMEGRPTPRHARGAGPPAEAWRRVGSERNAPSGRNDCSTGMKVDSTRRSQHDWNLPTFYAFSSNAVQGIV